MTTEQIKALYSTRANGQCSITPLLEEKFLGLAPGDGGDRKWVQAWMPHIEKCSQCRAEAIRLSQIAHEMNRWSIGRMLKETALGFLVIAAFTSLTGSSKESDR